eukprot:sb/3478240/
MFYRSFLSISVYFCQLSWEPDEIPTRPYTNIRTEEAYKLHTCLFGNTQKQTKLNTVHLQQHIPVKTMGPSRQALNKNKDTKLTKSMSLNNNVQCVPGGFGRV